MKLAARNLEGIGPCDLFWCPGCNSHMWFRTAPNPEPCWTFNGDMEKPTVTPSIRSWDGQINICHLFITDGKIQFLSDCTHGYAGKTIDMEEVSF